MSLAKSPRSALGKMRAAVSEFGPATACVYLAQRALERWGWGLYLYHFVAQPVRADAWLPPSRGQSIGVRLVDSKDPVLKEMPLDDKVIEYRATQNAVCLGAFKDGRMIGCLWLCLGPYREDEVRCNFVPSPSGRAAWDFDVYLRPEHRLGLGFTRLWDEANRFLRARNIRWSISRISVFNRSSLTSHAKLGARRIGSALFLRRRKLQLMLASLPPYLHLSLGGSRLPAIALHVPGEPTAPITRPE